MNSLLKKSLLVIGIFIVLLSACAREETIELKTDKVKEKLVVYGLLTPAEKVHVYVARSQSFGLDSYDPNGFIVNNATVSISNAHGEKKLLQQANGQPGSFSCLQSEFPILPGETYSLQVEVPSFPTVTATTTVPAKTTFWRETKVAKSADYGYELMGNWEARPENLNVFYGVGIIYPSNTAKTIRSVKEGIIPIDNYYTMSEDVIFSENESLQAVLLTQDVNFSEFSAVNELTFSIMLNYSNALFVDIISGYKGVIPQAGNIQNGLGVFGSYLAHSKTIFKPAN